MAKTKLDEDMIKFLCTAHENGAPQNTCAKLAGIDRKTLYNWIQKGKKAKKGKFHNFYLQWEKADGKFQTYHLTNITKQAEDDWRASKYLLEVNSPNDFVIEKKIQTINQTEINISKINPFEDLKKYKKKLEDDEIEELKEDLKNIDFNENN